MGPWPIRSLAHSLRGPFAPWPIRSLAISLPGSFAPRSEMAGPFAPGNESFCELSLPGSLVPGTFPPLIQDIAMQYATYCRLVALPLLPAEHIQPAFNNFCDSLPDDMDERVTALVTYVNDN